jgi:hypothetical protein
LTEWDWLLDSQSGSYTLTQSVEQGQSIHGLLGGIVGTIVTFGNGPRKSSDGLTHPAIVTTQLSLGTG